MTQYCVIKAMLLTGAVSHVPDADAFGGWRGVRFGRTEQISAQQSYLAQLPLIKETWSSFKEPLAQCLVEEGQLLQMKHIALNN